MALDAPTNPHTARRQQLIREREQEEQREADLAAGELSSLSPVASTEDVRHGAIYPPSSPSPLPLATTTGRTPNTASILDKAIFCSTCSTKFTRAPPTKCDLLIREAGVEIGDAIQPGSLLVATKGEHIKKTSIINYHLLIYQNLLLVTLRLIDKSALLSPVFQRSLPTDHYVYHWYDFTSSPFIYSYGRENCDTAGASYPTPGYTLHEGATESTRRDSATFRCRPSHLVAVRRTSSPSVAPRRRPSHLVAVRHLPPPRHVPDIPIILTTLAIFVTSYLILYTTAVLKAAHWRHAVYLIYAVEPKSTDGEEGEASGDNGQGIGVGGGGGGGGNDRRKLGAGTDVVYAINLTRPVVSNRVVTLI